MKYLLEKTFLVIALIVVPAITMAQEAPSLFSHTILELPFDRNSEEPWSEIIRTQEEWSAFYNELLEENAGDTVISFALPEIDFETFQLIAGGIGFRPSGAYSISVGRVIEMSEVIYIEVHVISPGENCIVTADIAYPSATILIKKTNKPIQFFSYPLIFECDL